MQYRERSFTRSIKPNDSFQTIQLQYLNQIPFSQPFTSMLVTDVGDDLLKMLVTVMTILVTNSNHLFTLDSGTNIQKTLPTSKFSYQHQCYPRNLTTINGNSYVGDCMEVIVLRWWRLFQCNKSVPPRRTACWLFNFVKHEKNSEQFSSFFKFKSLMWILLKNIKKCFD